MYQALIAACCALAGVHPPLAQNWSDTGLIHADDDWSGVPAIAGYRGDGLAGAPGIDPRAVVADGSGTPLDVAANRTDPGAIGLAAGVAEFELANPVVALRGSATASAPQLVIALDARGRAGIAVRLTLRDIDTTADAVQQVAVQYRVGGTGNFTNVPGGYVADATESIATDAPDAGIDSVNAASGELRTPVRVVLPPAADNARLVEVRVLTTDAPGRDEWVGVDDIEVTAAEPRPWPDREPGPNPPPEPRPWPDGEPGPNPPPERPGRARPALTGLSLTPAAFVAASRGPAVTRRGRAGTALRFRLSEPATVRFRIAPGAERLRFHVRGRRGLNRLRFTGRVRGRRLPAADFTLTAVATSRGGLDSAPATARFRIENPQD
jgi:hypothetical protein